MIDVKNFTFTELINTSKVPITDNIPASFQIIRNLLYSAEILQLIREHFGKPIIVNSGYRCPAVNKAVGGVENSLHLVGRGFDIRPLHGSVDELYQAIKSLDTMSGMVDSLMIDELIKHDTYIHIGFMQFDYPEVF